MFSEFWKSLGGSFEKRWLVNLFGPALVFWGAALWIWAQLMGLYEVLRTWQAYPAEVRLFLAAGGLLLVFFSAVLLDAFAGDLLRIYEGYWPRWPKLAQRRADDLHRKEERQRLLRTRLVTDQISTAESAELARLDMELAYRPRDPKRSMPTRLGDILRAAEDYPRERYGLDPILFWPRLFPQSSEPLRQALGAAQDQLDLALRLTTLALLYGIIWSIVVIARGQWAVLWWTLSALPLAWLLWQAAPRAAISYSGLFRSAFDLHRFDVYTSMHWPTCDSLAAEKAQASELMLFLLDGRGAKDVTLVVESKGQKEEGEQAPP